MIFKAFALILVINLCVIHTRALNIQQIDGQLNRTIDLQVNQSIEYIIEYKPLNSLFLKRIKLNALQYINPLRVEVDSDNVNHSAPLLVVVRQNKEVLSWQLPMRINDDTGGKEFRHSARTLCYDTSKPNNHTLIDLDQRDALIETPIFVSISSSSTNNVSVKVAVVLEEHFYVEPNKEYSLSIAPSESRFYFYDFPGSNVSTDDGDATGTVVFEVNSPDAVCMTVSIQNASCPVYDLNHNVKFEGYWETVNRKGGITISRTKFPSGFFVVFVAHGDDMECTGDASLNVPDRNKKLTFIIRRSIAYGDYVNAVLATVCCVLLFYIMFGVSFFMCSNRVYIPRTMEYMSQASTPTTAGCVILGEDLDPPLQDGLDNISFDETEYDTIAEATTDRDIILSKPVVYLSDLARKDFRILKKKSYSYLWHVLTVALFYGLPVIQLVITYQRVLNDTGNQDLCYYNFLCAHPLGFFSDFNHLFSNIGYVFLGFLFIVIVYRREKWHSDFSFDQQYGIPQHYGLFYAMGVALSMEGILSGSYHICPNHSNFQFDTSFMYVTAVLCMVKIYQTRHPDINATAYTTFAVLAVAILLGMLGILEADIYFWSGFTILHVLTGLYLTAQIYYMGCWRMDRDWLWRLYRLCVYEFWSGPINCIRPKYTGRFFLLLIGNGCNWTLAGFGLYNHERDFAMYLLAIFMMNTLLYFIFYITMKLLHRERINLIALLFLVISLSCAACAMYCFLNKSISWALSPAESRRFNQDCKLFRFYDYHDIWHFLSAIGMFFMFMVLLLLDEDLSHTHRSKIHVF